MYTEYWWHTDCIVIKSIPVTLSWAVSYLRITTPIGWITQNTISGSGGEKAPLSNLTKCSSFCIYDIGEMEKFDYQTQYFANRGINKQQFLGYLVFRSQWW